ncbi:MAG: DUF58 domain-containing protein [Actinomycetota bacterium]|nr:DUF58 domain-containing protein [Actinomycetota bacterium]
MAKTDVSPSEKKKGGVIGRSRSSRKARAAAATEIKGKALTRRDQLTDALTARSVKAKAVQFQRKIHLTRTGIVACVAAVIPWLIAFVIAGKALYVFAYGIFLLIAASYFLAPKKLKLSGDRSGLFPRAHEGDRLIVDVKLTAQKRVPQFILEERVPERLGTTVKVAVPKLSAGREVTHQYSLRCQRRGVYEIGPLVAVTSDPLGLTERETLVAEQFELLVHPRIEFVSDRPLTRQFEDPPIRPPVSKPWPSGLEFYGMREYSPGDDLRRIVWRASARTGKIMVREAEQGITDHVTIILDTDRGSHSKDGEVSESFEMGVRAAASLGVRHLREGYEVRVDTNGGALTRALRGAPAQLQLLDSLTRVDMHRDPLTTCITRRISDPRRDAHNILITPKLGNTEAAQLRILLNKGVSILVVALLWDEENASTLGVAAALGCQVAGVHPGQDLSTALYNGMGAGNRL